MVKNYLSNNHIIEKNLDIPKNIFASDNNISSIIKLVKMNAMGNEVLAMLKETKLPRCRRRNVMRNPNDMFYSCIIGKVLTVQDRRLQCWWSNMSKENPELTKLMFSYGETLFHDHKFNAICVNQSYQMARHKDKNNVGDSYIIGLGDYTGGELRVWDKNGENPVDHDIQHKPLKFNGSQYFHEVRPFEGERWSLIFYHVEVNRVD